MEGQREMKDVTKRNAEMLIAFVPLLCGECRRKKDFSTDLITSPVEKSHKTSHCLGKAFSQMYHDGELDTQEVHNFWREEVFTNSIKREFFGIAKYRKKQPKSVLSWCVFFHKFFWITQFCFIN